MRKHSKTFTATVDVDVALEDIDSDDLREELMARGEYEPRDDAALALCKEALDKLYGKNVREAITLLERALYPKWHDKDLCQRDYEKAMADTQYARKINTGTPSVRGASGHALSST